jgi:hypothetical protein
MSNVIAFPRAASVAPMNTDSELASRKEFTFYMSQPDPRGMVLLDACVPDALAREVLALAEVEKFSCDITAPDERGFVLLDGCVSHEIAVAFMGLVSFYAPATAA